MANHVGHAYARGTARPRPAAPPCLQGYLFGLLSALLSAVAAVYTEWVMKSNNDSLYWQVGALSGGGE